MNDLAVTILAETADDAQAIEHLHEHTFGPGRFAKTAYRLRERTGHRPELSFTARIGTLLVGSVWLTPVCIGEARALLLGPLTIEPPFRDRGIGLKLMQRAMAAAKGKGHRLVFLVGDEPYYARAGFKRVPKGKVNLTGPADEGRDLVAELVEGAFASVAGEMQPDWDAATA